MDVKTCLGWVRLYEQLGEAGLVCRRCGISQPTLRKWWRRYQAHGVCGLSEESRRPQHLARQKVFAEQEALILGLRRSRHLGIKQLRSELLRQHGLEPVARHAAPRSGPLRRTASETAKAEAQRREALQPPGNRVQLDVCKIVPAVYQYTATGDCSRYRVLGIYSRRTATNTLNFLKRLIEEMSFPIQRLQSAWSSLPKLCSGG